MINVLLYITIVITICLVIYIPYVLFKECSSDGSINCNDDELYYNENLGW